MTAAKMKVIGIGPALILLLTLGAGGACSVPSSAGQVGGRGADGLITIYEYA